MSEMNEHKKLCTNTNVRNAAYAEIGIGILANTILLLFHVLLFILRYRTKPTDLPVALLALIHLVLLIITGFLATDMFAPQPGRWGVVTCQSVIYVYSLTRALSMCTTCLLSVLQAVILSPRSSWLAKFKNTSSLQNLCSLLFLGAFYTSFPSHFSVSSVAAHNLTSDSLLYITQSCYLVYISNSLEHMVYTLLTFKKVVMAGLMSLSSGYMVALLCRHKRRSQHLHSTNFSPKASPEQRATRTILTLTSCFVLMCILESLASYVRFKVTDDPVFYCLQILVVHMYATISPLVFIGTEKRVINIFRSMCEKIVNISPISGG